MDVRRIAIVAVIGALTTACASQRAPVRRGPFAFHYGPGLSAEALEWYSKFELLVTHDPLPADQVARLRAAGTKLVLYEWAVAFYASRANEWQRSLRDEQLLHREALTGGAGSATAAAWYFDPAVSGHAVARAGDIAARLEAIGYDGVFLDTTTVESVHPKARKEYERRHPDLPYDVAYSRFLAELRARLPRGIIFTNQGYRSAEHYLPYADWDLTESLITWKRDGTQQLRPWNDESDPWNSIHFVMRTMIAPLVERYPRVRFAHLNYIDGANPETTRVIVAVAQMFGGEGYAAASDPRAEMDAIYFVDPGKPVGPRADDPDGRGSRREFEHGIIKLRESAGVLRATFVDR